MIAVLKMVSRDWPKPSGYLSARSLKAKVVREEVGFEKLENCQFD